MSQLLSKIETLSPNPAPATTLVRNLLPRRHQNYRKAYTYTLLLKSFVMTQLFCLFFFSNHPQWARASLYTRFLDHTQRRITFGRIPPDE